MTSGTDLNQRLLAGIAAVSGVAVIQRVGANAHYARAIQKNPNYQQAADVRDKAIQTRAALALARPQAPQMPTTIADDLDSFLCAAAQAAATDAECLAKDQALVTLIAHCEARIQGVGLDHDGILRSLQGDLDDLMRRVTEAVDKLGGARTPTEVIAAGSGNAWNTIAQLRSEYDQIREAHDMAMAGQPEIAMARSNYLYYDDLASDAHIANLDEVFVNWRDPAPSHLSVSLSPDHNPRPQPWPSDAVGQLIWLATSGARAWTPTTQQLNELWIQRRKSRAHTNYKADRKQEQHV